MSLRFFRLFLAAFFVLTLLTGTSFAQPSLKAVWTQGMPADVQQSTFEHIVKVPDGIVASGTIANPYAEQRIVKYDRNGKLLWSVRPRFSTEESLIKIIAGKDGSLYVLGTVGYFFAGQVSSPVIMCFAPDGSKVWEFRTGETFWSGFIALDPEDNPLFVFSQKTIRSGQVELTLTHTIKLDHKTGNQIWRKTLTDTSKNGNLPEAVAVDASGNTFICGEIVPDASFYHAYLLSYDAQGNQRFLHRLTDEISTYATLIALDKTGNVFLGLGDLENRFDSSQTNVGVTKFDSAGNRLWTKFYSGISGKAEHPYSLVVDNSGNPILSATAQSINNLTDVVLLKYSSDGVALWTRRHFLLGSSGDSPRGLAVDANDNVYFGIQPTQNDTTEFPNFYVYMLGADDGQIRWSAQQPGSGYKTAYLEDVTADERGNVYAVGMVSVPDTRFGSHTERSVMKFSPYRAVDSSVGTDSRLRLLTRRADDRFAQLRLIQNSTGAVERISTLPLLENTVPQAICTAPDNRTYILYQRSDGQAVIDQYNATLSTREKRLILGPIGGQRPLDLACGLDNVLRLSWRSTNPATRHRLILWTMKPDLADVQTIYSYNPPTATEQRAISVGRDNRARVLWGTTTTPTTGKHAIYTVSRLGDTLNQVAPFGPFPDRKPVDIAMGFDQKARVLYQPLIDGPMYVDRLDVTGTSIERTLIIRGLPPKTRPLSLTSSLMDSGLWLLVDYRDGRCLFRQINPSTGEIVNNLTYSPY